MCLGKRISVIGSAINMFAKRTQQWTEAESTGLLQA